MSARPFTGPVLLVGGGADREDVRWAAGFDAPDPFLFLLHGNRRHVVVSPLELGRALRTGNDLECHGIDDLGLEGEERRSYGAQAAALLRRLHVREVGVSARCPVGLVRQLEERAVRATVLPDPVFPMRLQKTENEILALRRSQRAAVAAMKAAMGLIAGSTPGKGGRLEEGGRVLTSERVKTRIEQVLLESQCVCEDLIVAGGEQGVDPHERGSGPLRAGETVVMDIFPRSRVSGYWGDITRTVIRGEATPEQRRLYATVLRVQKAAVGRVRAGVTGAEIHAGVCADFEAAGYRTGKVDGIPRGFIHSTGHGVGLEIHEGPSVGPLGGPLEPGQVITIEPGLYYPGVGAVRIEDTVVVTETGCEPLATCTKRFEL